MRNVRVSSPFKDSEIQALSILGTAISMSDRQRYHGEGTEGKEVAFSVSSTPQPQSDTHHGLQQVWPVIQSTYQQGSWKV